MTDRVDAAAPPSTALEYSTRGTRYSRTLLSWMTKKEYRIEQQPSERLRATDRAVRGSTIGRCVMGRKTAFSLCLGAGLMFVALIVAANFVSTPAVAQGNCPPGQIFVPLENKCVGLGGVGSAQRCPQGQEFDASTNRCITAGRAVRCPQGQEFDESSNRCVAAGRAVRCPQGQEFDQSTNRCVAAGRGVRCPQGQEFDQSTNRCVTAGRGVRCPQGQEFDERSNRCVSVR
jgi:hypothetical protein